MEYQVSVTLVSDLSPAQQVTTSDFQQKVKDVIIGAARRLDKAGCSLTQVSALMILLHFI